MPPFEEEKEQCLMAFPDPQSVTIAAATTSLPLVSRGEHKAVYSSGDGLIDLTASHAYGRRIRRVLRLDHSKVSADPYQPDTNVERSMSCYTVFDIPPYGYTPAQALEVYEGFETLLTANSSALITKLLGGES
jgi:hypothetical protein